MIKHLVSILILPIAAAFLAAGCAPKPPKEEMGAVPPMSFIRQASIDLHASSPVRSLYVGENYIIAYTQENEALGLHRASLDPAFGTAVCDPARTLYPPIPLKEWVVYPTSSSLEVYDYNGKFLRSIKLQFALRSAGVGGMVNELPLVFLGADFAGGGRLVCINTAESQVYGTKWEIGSPHSGISASPALVDNKYIFAGSSDGNVYAAQAIDKRASWLGLPGGVFSTHGEITADLQADKDGVYVGSMDTKLYCLTLTDGRIKWEYHAQKPLNPEVRIIATDNSVYLAVPGEGVAAIDKQGDSFDRPARWVVRDAVQFLSKDEKYAYLRTKDNHIIAVDKQTGAFKFASKRNDFTVFGTNTKGDGVIYAANKFGVVYSIVPVFKETQGVIVMDVRVREVGAVAMAK